ncbi:hypothetical protein [Kocuria sp. HSID16901]|uniref:hypothetical protein n=1 Tax=Kocuria sp. HSID16901 TaxID=2419505 RepID=UPI000F884A87|nr:hypothetical protein [Kocuria sp. HSID16901]RUQ19586.1 hypothetical protein D8M21_11260 [Kocuria sp. HSID16901]
MSKKTKRPGQPHSRAKKKQKAQIDWSDELRRAHGQMRQSKEDIESGSTYASRYRRPQKSSGKTDGKWF